MFSLKPFPESQVNGDEENNEDQFQENIVEGHDSEYAAVVTQPLPTIEEGRLLLIECHDDAVAINCNSEDGSENHFSTADGSRSTDQSIELSTGSNERTSLLKSTESLVNSYTENSRKTRMIADTQEHVSEYRFAFSEADRLSDYQSSTMTDFQASLFLPSLLLSSYSSIKQSYDLIMQRSIAQSNALHSSKSVIVSLIEKVSDDRGASWQLTFFNLMPYLVGTSLFAMPFCLAKSGYVIVAAFALTALLSDITSISLLDSMYEICPKSKRRKRICGDYVDIAKAAFGEKASKLMNLLLITHLFTSGVVTFVLLGNSIFAILSLYVPLSKIALTGIFSILVLPTLFVRKLSKIAYMSMVTILALIIGALTTLAIFIKDSNSWKHNAEVLPTFDWNYFAYSLSMWLYTLIIHATLPQMEGSIRNPSEMKKAVHLSMVVSTSIKIIYGLMGALTFGSAAKVLVTDNVIKISYAVSVTVNVVVCIYAIFAFPLFFFVVCDAFDSITLRGKYPKLQRQGQYHRIWLLLTRPLLIGSSLAIALVVPFFGPLIGVFGSVLGTLLVFIFPCLFHLKLKWSSLSKLQKTIDIFIIFAGSIFGAIGLYSSVKQLYFAVHSKG